MSKININDRIKALRCLASNDPEGNCYEDQYNFGNDGQRISCNGYLGTLKCRYNQRTYDVCFEDGDCSEWLSKVAELLEELLQYLQIGTLEECRVAMKKQKPMEVTDIDVDEYHCPVCGTENCCDQGIVGDKHCPECGQSLEQRCDAE